jgi:hypothetical protein
MEGTGMEIFPAGFRLVVVSCLCLGLVVVS